VKALNDGRSRYCALMPAALTTLARVVDLVAHELAEFGGRHHHRLRAERCQRSRTSGIARTLRDSPR
jgi:hypothetical protein